MKILKIVNNNVVVSLDGSGMEIVAMGRGLAFQCRPGDTLDEARVEKVFTLKNRELATKFQQAIAEIPLEHILLTERIIAMAMDRLDKSLHDSIYITLPDHISTALERYREGMVLKNPMLLEIKRFYREEYALGEAALELIAAETGVRFEADEAAFIAMHFVNAELNGDMSDIQAVTRFIDEIVGLVAARLPALPDEESITWFRFVTHVKFFAQRLVQNADYGDGDFELYDLFAEKYPAAFRIACDVASHVKARYGHRISKEEMAYLTMHIRRLSAD